MKAILIDPVTQYMIGKSDPTHRPNIADIVQEIEIAGPDGRMSLDKIYQAMGINCFTVAATLPNGDIVIVDDNGLLGSGERVVTKTPWYPHPLAGRVLIMTDANGDVVTTAAEVCELVRLGRIEFGVIDLR